MLDSPHTSAPMLMRGNALVLKTPVENAPRTSVEKHLSWREPVLRNTCQCPENQCWETPVILVNRKSRRKSCVASRREQTSWSQKDTAILLQPLRDLQICGTPRNGGDTSVTVVTSKIWRKQKFLYLCIEWVPAWNDNKCGENCIKLLLKKVICV